VLGIVASECVPWLFWAIISTRAGLEAAMQLQSKDEVSLQLL
jgi:hypothetical protein